MALLLIPVQTLARVYADLGLPNNPEFFENLGEYIQDYFKEHKANKLKYVKKPDRDGTSKEQLMRAIGYSPTLKGCLIENACGANNFIRQVLSHKYHSDNWDNTLRELEIKEDTLKPPAKNNRINKAQLKEIRELFKGRNESIIGELSSNIEAEDFDFPTMEKIGRLFPVTTSNQQIAGYWLSKFDYMSYRDGELIPGVQYDIERLVAVNEHYIYGYNITGISKSLKVYLHELKAKLIGDFLLGSWYNIDTKNIGAFQLHIYTSLNIMSGCHIGNANNNSIQSGEWTWVKLNINDMVESTMQVSKMKNLDQLTSQFVDWRKMSNLLPIQEIFI